MIWLANWTQVLFFFFNEGSWKTNKAVHTQKRVPVMQVSYSHAGAIPVLSSLPWLTRSKRLFIVLVGPSRILVLTKPPKRGWACQIKYNSSKGQYSSPPNQQLPSSQRYNELLNQYQLQFRLQDYGACLPSLWEHTQFLSFHTYKF